MPCRLFNHLVSFEIKFHRIVSHAVITDALFKEKGYGFMAYYLPK